MQRKMPLPRGWKRRVRSSVLHVLTLGHHDLLEQRTFARHTWTTSAVAAGGTGTHAISNPPPLALDSFAGHLDVSFGADDVLPRGHAVFAKVQHAGQELAAVGQIDLGDRQVLSDTMTVDL